MNMWFLSLIYVKHRPLHPFQLGQAGFFKVKIEIIFGASVREKVAGIGNNFPPC